MTATSIAPAPPARAALSAIRPTERLRILDILRGFAIFGILLVNIHFYSRPIYTIFRGDQGSTVDQIIKFGTMFLVTEKFISTLSLLFGIGVAILFQRALDKGAPVGRVFLRRQIGLFAIGITHALALYSGDFIGNYAVLGLLLFLFRKARGRTLLAASAITLLVPCLYVAPAMLSRPGEAPARPDPQAQQALRQQRREALARRIEESVEVYGHGDISQIFRLRSREVRFQYASLLFVGWKMFSMFLLGMWCWRSGLASSLEDRLPFLRKVVWTALTIGVLGTSLGLAGDSLGLPQNAPVQLAAALGREIGAPALAVFYSSAITLLYFGGVGRRVFDWLAPVGRTAMSNYVFQSVVCTTIFYSYGLGLFYRTTYSINVALALGVFAIEIIVSRSWLRRFDFGPLEWLLRAFVYLRPASMARGDRS
ncbi:MAG: DUF418 domain-containing protein [Acidobacteria bacterium]|nr:DUF418 domain-containing protein [Acidobacteriota bacterium]